MVFRSHRLCGLVLSVGLCVRTASALDSPLSENAVREAYFLGQRHDARYLSPYIKFLPMPKTGPQIFSISLLTPFAQLAGHSSSYIGKYSAQQAVLDHRGKPEIVKVILEIRLTSTYSALMNDPSKSNQGSGAVRVERPHNFWKDFQVQVFNGEKSIAPAALTGSSNNPCGRYGPCALTGATIELDFLADSIEEDSATIRVVPPEGDPVSVTFNLSALR
jgi:hypothetical protein